MPTVPSNQREFSDYLGELIDAGFGIAVKHARVLFAEQRVLDPGESGPLPAL